MAHALGVTNSEDRRGMSEQKDGQTHAVTDARTVERELAWCYWEGVVSWEEWVCRNPVKLGKGK